MPTADEPAPRPTGQALAEHYFGPLMSPIAATPAQWTAYAEHRRRTNARSKNVFTRRKQLVSDAVADVEGKMALDAGALQKCVSVMSATVQWAHEDVSGKIRWLIVRDAEIGSRVYSLAAPKYIDVHVKYHCCPGSYDVEWDYSLGYQIHHHIPDPPARYRNPSTKGVPSIWHTRGGWKSICWGHYADDDEDDQDYDAFDYHDTYPDWRRIEEGEVELRQDGVLEIYETLFGPIETSPGGDAAAVLAYRRKLVAAVRLLFAAVGIDYKVACVDEETDRDPAEFMLEGLSDTWVARGIRAACGFQLDGDEEAAKLGEEERREEASRKLGYDESEDDDDLEDDNDFSDESMIH